MKKETNVRPLKQVVRAKKRGSSGLPGAAQRARSRQIMADLENALGYITAADDYLRLGCPNLAVCGTEAANRMLNQSIAALRRRRPFGANDKLCHRDEKEK